MRSHQAENLLGALALAVSDRVAEAMSAAAGEGVARFGVATDATALVALDRLLDGPPVDTLARALGLTSSGTVASSIDSSRPVSSAATWRPMDA